MAICTASAADLECHVIQPWRGENKQLFTAVEVATDRTCGLSVEEVFGDTAEVAWRAVRDEYYDGDYNACTWVRVCQRFETAEEVYVETGIHARSELYVYRDGRRVATHEMGNDLALSSRAAPVIWPKSYRNLAPLSAEPGTYVFYFRVRNVLGPSILSTYSKQQIRLWRAAHVNGRAPTQQTVTAFIAGWLTLLLLYHGFLYFMSRSRLIFWYTVYMASQLAYIGYEDFLLVSLFPGVAFRDAFLTLTITTAPYCFFRFMRAVIEDVDPDSAGVIALLRWFAREKLALGAFWLALLLARLAGLEEAVYPLGYIPLYYRIGLLVQIVATVPMFWGLYRRVDNPAVKALTFGMFALAVCIFIYISEVFLDPLAHVPPIGAFLEGLAVFVNYLVEIGIVVMSLAFAVAVALVVRDRERERERDTSRRLLRMEMSALRAQMNPHFLFNGLNSIKLFVIRNQPREASDYLTRFSRLIRLILENSAESMVSLQADLEALKLYVELESLRFEGRFEYRFEMDAAVDAEAVRIPPTLLQPYVENAIWHGLLHRAGGGGVLSVDIAQVRADRIEIRIRDNGIGRAAAERLKSRTATRRKSLGMRITQDRLDILGRAYGFDAEVVVHDLKDGANAAGTEVVILLTYAAGPPLRAAGAAPTHLFANVT